jgi:hypothetical protein
MGSRSLQGQPPLKPKPPPPDPSGRHQNLRIALGENDWGTHAADGRCVTSLARNALGEDWRLCVGFIGHGGLPRFFNPTIGEWDLNAPLACAKEAARGEGRTP